MSSYPKLTAEEQQAIADRDWWESIFKPLGCTLIGWTYRNYCQVRLPSGRYLEVDQKVLELMKCMGKEIVA